MTKVNIEKVMNATGPWGRSLDHVRPNFAWDFEEATAIEIARNRRKFTQEIASYLQSNFDMSDDLTASLLKIKKPSLQLRLDNIKCGQLNTINLTNLIVG